MSIGEVSFHEGGGPTVIPPEGKRRAPVRLYQSARLGVSAYEIAGLEQAAGLPGVCEVVALPDLHYKPLLETPSSVATATQGVVYLGLSSPSAGCGMALAVTSLTEDELNPARLDDFFASLARRLPARRDERTLPRQAVQQALPEFLARGAEAALAYFNLDASLAQVIDGCGNAFSDFPAELSEILTTIPANFLPQAAQEFGIIGRGNHFFELQVVTDLLDKEVAAQWGLSVGQVVAMYHADSGRLGALLGRLYAHRKKNTWRGRWLELRYKTRFHLDQAHSVEQAWRRFKYFYTPRKHVALDEGSPEARQALLAQAAAANYATANRLAILAGFGDALCSTWGSVSEGPRLLVDLSHNHIRRERVHGKELWVHRHNASRALPAGYPELAAGPYAGTGQPLLLPGLSTTSSYLCVALAGTAGSLYSVDHGAGRSAQRLGQGQAAAGITRLYGYGQGGAELQQHISDDGVDEVVALLRQANLAAPVARLRPVGVLKDRSR